MSVDLNKLYLVTRLTDVSSSVTSYITVPNGGTLTRISTVPEVTLAGAGDSIVTVTVGTLTAGTLTFPSGAVGGVVIEAVCNCPIPANGIVKITSDGGGLTLCQLFITLTVYR